MLKSEALNVLSQWPAELANSPPGYPRNSTLFHFHYSLSMWLCCTLHSINYLVIFYLLDIFPTVTAEKLIKS